MKKPWQFENPSCAEVGGDNWFVDPNFVGGFEQVRMTKKICESCVEKRDCFTYAISHDVYGIWGATTRRERKEIQKTNKIKVIPIYLGGYVGTRDMEKTA